jgi:hypothetical protein
MVILVFSPVILLVGEPVNRYVMRHLHGKSRLAGTAVIRRTGQPTRTATAVQLTAPSSLLLLVISNPLWIALTAPGRWVWDRLGTPPPRTKMP